jgi:mannonate dehydratase
MKQTWRWFGPQDPVSLDQVKQAGAAGVVTALHHLYQGEPWSFEEVRKRKEELQGAGLDWSVVESIPVHNSIKLRSGRYREFIDAWKDSLAAIGKAGIETVCYNFMPVVDWVRTDLRWRAKSTGYALRFDFIDFAAYDVFILARKRAEEDYIEEVVGQAKHRFEAMSEEQQQSLEINIIAGLPGNEGSHDREGIRRLIAEYEGFTAGDLRNSLQDFLREVVPVAAELNIRLAIHPDDPPISLFGMPRVVSTLQDLEAIVDAVDSRSNGITFCVGSLGARADNDLSTMLSKLAERIHFVHLRQVRRESNGSFYEAEHLDGSSDMVGLIQALLKEEQRRRQEGRVDHEIPMRPDHGHLLADDINKRTNPGYSLIGRLKGLAELRGVIRGLEYAAHRATQQSNA